MQNTNEPRRPLAEMTSRQSALHGIQHHFSLHCLPPLPHPLSQFPPALLDHVVLYSPAVRQPVAAANHPLLTLHGTLLTIWVSSLCLWVLLYILPTFHLSLDTRAWILPLSPLHPNYPQLLDVTEEETTPY